MADFIDAMSPDVPVDVGLSHSTYFYEGMTHPDTGQHVDGGTPIAMAVLISHLGPVKKDAGEATFDVQKDFGGGVTLRWWASRTSVCHAKVVGTRTVPAEAEKIIPAKPERVEEVVEYECPSLMRELRRPTTVEVPKEAALPSPSQPLLAVNDIPF
jgi:hypothetical protein